MNLFVVANKG